MKELLTEFFASILTEKTDELDAYGKTTIDGEVVYVYGPGSRPKKDRVPSNATHFAKPGQTQSKQPLSVKQKAQIAKQPAGKPSAKKKAPAKKDSSQTGQSKKDRSLQQATRGKVVRTVKIDRSGKPSESVTYDSNGVDERLDERATTQAPTTFSRQFPKNNDAEVSAKLKKLKVKPSGAKVTSKQIEASLGISRDNPAKFPPKYISTIVAMLNHQNGYTITDITGTAGAGTLDSTSGEIIAMMSMSIEDDAQREEFFNLLERAIEEGGGTSPITKEWVASARATAKAFSRKLKRDCPGGHKIVSAFWDITAEAQAAGVKNYKSTKGKSTDVNVVVDCKGKNGKTVRKWYQPSLKKDKKVNGFNGSTSRVFAIMVYRHGTPEQIAQYDALGNELDSYEGMDGNIQLSDGKTVAQRKTEIGKEMDRMEQELSKGKIPPKANVEGVKQRQQKLHQEIERDREVIKELDQTIVEWIKLNKNKNKAERERQRREFAWDIMQEMNQGVNRREAAKKPPSKLEQEILDMLDGIAEISTPAGRSRLMQTSAGRTGEVLPTIQGYMGTTAARSRMKLNVEILSANIVTQRRLGRNPTKSASYQHKEKTDNNSRAHGTAVLEFLTDTHENRMALMRSISTVFPLRDLMEGRENLIMGENKNPPDGINLDAHTISQCLGVSSFEEVVERLTIVKDEEGNDVLVYSAGNDTDTHIPIGIINARPDGISYGDTWKLEMNIHPGFSECCARHDK